MSALSAHDQAEISTLWQRMGDAVGTKDGAAIGALYSDDADLIGIDGTVLTGRKAIADYYEVELHKKYANVKMTDVSFEPPRPIATGVAMINGTWMMHGLKAEPIHVRSTMIVRRGPEGWRYVATRYMAAVKLS
jgi:uncharacterized protein (TIGR02246 family)